MFGAIILIIFIIFSIVTEAQLGGSMTLLYNRETEAQREVAACIVAPGKGDRTLTPTQCLPPTLASVSSHDRPHK